MRFHLPTSSAALFALAGFAQAQTIVGDGDDLAAIVAAAADGDVIQIDSDETFVGTLFLGGRDLSISAGPGFAPTIQGSEDFSGISMGAGSAGSAIKLIGLRVRGGAPSDPNDPIYSPISLSCSGTGSTLQVASGLFQDCRFDDRVSIGGTGLHRSELEVFDCDFNDFVSIGGTGDASADCDFALDCRFQSLSISGTGDFVADVRVISAKVDGPVTIGGTGGFNSDVILRRVEATGGISVSGISLSNNVALVESCLFPKGADATGFTGMRASSNASVDFVACTATGWDTGLDLNAASTADNLALFGNDLDVSAGTTSGSVTNSLVSDGSYTGFGCVQGNPVWDSEYAFVTGSIGIDQGNGTNPALGNFDVYGNSRFLDGDGDGLAEVNYGAVEFVGSCQIAALQLINGNGFNPEGYHPQSLPVVGQIFDALIDINQQSVLTILAVDQESPLPFPIPGVQGEILLGLTPNLFLDYGVAVGKHSLPIPHDPALCGAKTATQGVRVDFDALSGVIDVIALNGYEVRLGS